MTERTRLHIADSLRGLVIVLMIFYHLAYDLYYYGGLLSGEWMYSPPMNALQMFIGGTFITLSGVASRYSRNNLMRGLRLFGVAMGLTLVTYVMGNPILFGVLHLLSVSMMLYGATSPLWNAIPERLAPAVYVLGFILGSQIKRLNPVGVGWLFPVGLYGPGFYSADYYPLLPWLFLFLLGTWLGGVLINRRAPERIYQWKPGPLAWLGRRSLVIYIIHQPVLFALTQLILYLR